MTHRTRHLPTLILSILIAQSAGLIGSLYTFDAVREWYPTLVKPSWNPPSWIFGPVWTTLYTMIGVSLYLMWTRHVGKRVRGLWLRVFALQLALNALWSILFFGKQLLGVAFAEIIVLLCSIITLIVLAWHTDRRVSALLVPYAAWVSFAAYLNYTIWQLNA
jgi:tryptophan-rich sensory protein